ncbi:hypothetical protein ACTXT7_000455 [Hymenolepis weldensis]
MPDFVKSNNGIPLAIKNGHPEKWIIEEGNCDIFCTPICGLLRDLFSEILKIISFEIDDWLNRIPTDARKCFEIDANYLHQITKAIRPAWTK